mgnify:CR=1 FL=1
MRRIPWHRLLPKHQRIALFWVLAGLGISAPWLVGDRIAFHTASEVACTIVDIHDGDTLRAICDGQNTTIRLYCIDAPELSQRPWGQTSRDHLRAITPRRVVLVAKNRDRYGRIVGVVLTVDRRESLNLALVRSGQAAVYPRYCNDRRFYAAETAARDRRLGVWARAGAHQRPWRIRR